MGIGIEPQVHSPKIHSLRPAVPLAASVSTGIAVHNAVPAGAWLALAIVALVVSALARRASVTCVLLCGVVTCSGALLARSAFERFARNDIALFSTDTPRYGFFELRLSDEPAIVAGQFGQLRELPPKQVVPADVLAVKTWTGWVPASGHTLLQIDGVHPLLSAGQRVRVFAALQRPATPSNPGQFDWAAFYRQQRVLVTLTVPHVDNVERMGEPTPPWRVRVQLHARALLSAGFTQVHALDAALLESMLLGDRAAVLREEMPTLRRAGLAFQMNVSGYHVALLGAGVWLVCRLLRLRPRTSLLTATGCALGYAVMAAPSYSGSRAILAASLLAVAVLLRRTLDRFQLLALAALAILLWHPLDLFTLGLQLSGAVLLGVMLFLPAFEQFWLERQEIHARLAPTREPTRWQRFRGWLGRRVKQTLLVGAIAWLAVLPLAAHEFGELNFWTPLLGVVLLPGVLLCMGAGLAKIGATLLWPTHAAWWAAMAGVPVAMLRHLAEWLATVPGERVAAQPPSPWLTLTYYALLLLPLVPVRWIGGRKRWIVRLAPVLGVLAVLWLPARGEAPQSATGLRVTLLSLGAGQCAVVQPPGDASPVLFDDGSTTVNDLVRTIIAPFFRAVGISHVDRILLSHGDYDHISATGQVAVAYGVRQVLVSPHFRPNATGNEADQMLLAELDGLGLTPGLIARGDHVDLGGGAMVAVLWPPPDGDLNSNNAGLVLRLTYAGRSILFPADIQDPAFAGLLLHRDELPSDVLVAAHHGSSEVLTPPFLRAVAPRVIVSSNAARLTVKQKVFDHMVGSTPLYRTSVCGAITVAISPDGVLTVRTFRGGATPVFSLSR